MSFGYDPLGRCVKRWTGGAADPATNPAIYFYYDGSSLIQEGPSASTISQVYMLGDRVDDIVADYAVANGQWIYHHTDPRGHTTMLTDSGGNLVEQYEYDAFGVPYFFNSTGQPLNSSAFGNRFLFTAREYLSELKLYDYRARMYQPELGRFLQPDPKEFAAGDYNLYRYCHNDPVNGVDPMGLAETESSGQEATASQWNHQLWLTGGSPLSSNGYDLARQGKAKIDAPTGNWKDSNVDNHTDTSKIGKRDGGTIYDLNLQNADESNGQLTLKPTLNWYVQPGSKYTDVVTRELEHVSRYLYWQGDGDLGIAIRNFNRKPTTFDALKSTLREEKIVEDALQEADIHKDGRHNSTKHRPKPMEPEAIKKAIENVPPNPQPYLGKDY